MSYEQEYIKAFGKNLKRIRKSKKLTQLDVASNCNLEESSYRRVEIGKTNPSLKMMLKISQGLGVDISDLFEFEEED